MLPSCSGDGPDRGGRGQPASTALESAATTAAANPAPTQAATEAAIQSIKEQYAAIQGRIPSLRRVKRDVSGFSTEGGTMTAFFDGNILRLVQATSYGETGRSFLAIYYGDGGLPFFVLERESRYDEPLSGRETSREYRSYFHEGRLIRLLDGEQQVPVSDAQHAARARQVMELSSRLADEARKR
jgi:hypothetical protein